MFDAVRNIVSDPEYQAKIGGALRKFESGDLEGDKSVLINMFDDLTQKQLDDWVAIVERPAFTHLDFISAGSGPNTEDFHLSEAIYKKFTLLPRNEHYLTPHNTFLIAAVYSLLKIFVARNEAVSPGIVLPPLVVETQNTKTASAVVRNDNGNSDEGSSDVQEKKQIEESDEGSSDNQSVEEEEKQMKEKDLIVAILKLLMAMRDGEIDPNHEPWSNFEINFDTIKDMPLPTLLSFALALVGSAGSGKSELLNFFTALLIRHKIPFYFVNYPKKRPAVCRHIFVDKGGETKYRKLYAKEGDDRVAECVKLLEQIDKETPSIVLYDPCEVKGPNNLIKHGRFIDKFLPSPVADSAETPQQFPNSFLLSMHSEPKSRFDVEDPNAWKSGSGESRLFTLHHLNSPTSYRPVLNRLFTKIVTQRRLDHANDNEIIKRCDEITASMQTSELYYFCNVSIRGYSTFLQAPKESRDRILNSLRIFSKKEGVPISRANIKLAEMESPYDSYWATRYVGSNIAHQFQLRSNIAPSNIAPFLNHAHDESNTYLPTTYGDLLQDEYYYQVAKRKAVYIPPLPLNDKLRHRAEDWLAHARYIDSTPPPEEIIADMKTITTNLKEQLNKKRPDDNNILPQLELKRTDHLQAQINHLTEVSTKLLDLEENPQEDLVKSFLTELSTLPTTTSHATQLYQLNYDGDRHHFRLFNRSRDQVALSKRCEKGQEMNAIADIVQNHIDSWGHNTALTFAFPPGYESIDDMTLVKQKEGQKDKLTVHVGQLSKSTAPTHGKPVKYDDVLVRHCQQLRRLLPNDITITPGTPVFYRPTEHATRSITYFERDEVVNFQFKNHYSALAEPTHGSTSLRFLQSGVSSIKSLRHYEDFNVEFIDAFTGPNLDGDRVALPPSKQKQMINEIKGLKFKSNREYYQYTLGRYTPANLSKHNTTTTNKQETNTAEEQNSLQQTTTGKQKSSKSPNKFTTTTTQQSKTPKAYPQ